MKKQGFWAKLLGKSEVPATPEIRKIEAVRPLATTPAQRAQIRKEAANYRAQRDGRSRGPVTNEVPTTDNSWLLPYIASSGYDSDRSTRSHDSTPSHSTPSHSGYTHHDSGPSHSSSYDHGSSFGGSDFGGGGGGGDFGGGGF